MRYRKTGNSLLGYVALTQIALAFVVLAGIIGMKQYGIWYYLGRILMIEGFVSLMIGLLSEYERLYRREREGRQTLEAIMENIPVGLAVAGGPPDFPITMVSRHGLEMIQDPAGKLIGTPNGKRQAAWKLFFPDEKTQAQPEQMPLYKAGQYGEETRNRELVMEVQEGRKIPVLINAAPIRNTQGEVVGAINTWMDITERKQTEEALRKRARELERANRDLRNITMVASHDLQEPLRKIEALGDSILVMTSDLDERLYDRIQRMRNSARQMRNMITGLNELSFLTTDIQPFQSVDLNEITTEVLGKLDRKIQESGASVEVGELPTIDADPKQMRILLHHLIDNALKFQPKGGKPLVRVSSHKPTPSTIQILVEDNGIGFDENHAKYLFRPFARLDGKNQSEYEGIGMGLAICRWITEHHGGEITARSSPGRGATFIVTIPVFQQKDTENTT